jgi:calcium channel MID1
MIPRCVDYSTVNTLLQERNIFAPFPNGTMLDSNLLTPSNNVSYMNSSRNPNIDTFVMPGPYKELLPCDDLCYSIVQSCPAAMGFSCPLPSTLGFNRSYGQRPQANQQGNLTCNFPGAMRDVQNTGYVLAITYAWGIVTSLLVFFLLM